MSGLGSRTALYLNSFYDFDAKTMLLALDRLLQ